MVGEQLAQKLIQEGADGVLREVRGMSRSDVPEASAP
jgi:hypothetical protein